MLLVIGRQGESKVVVTFGGHTTGKSPTWRWVYLRYLRYDPLDRLPIS